MDYIYEMDIFSGKRRVRATYPDTQPMDDGQFPTVELANAGPTAEPDSRFTESHMEVLVNLFTDDDPVKLLDDAARKCRHRTEEDCDCGTVSVSIPAALALHARILRENVTKYDQQDRTIPQNSEEHAARKKALVDRWYEQGIALYHAWVEPGS